MSFQLLLDYCHFTVILSLFPEHHLLLSPAECCSFVESAINSDFTVGPSLLKAPRVIDRKIAQSESAFLTQIESCVRSYGDVKFADSHPKD